MLVLEGLHSYYGRSHILQGVDLTVPDGKVVGLLGRNGAGKTTTLKAVMGAAATPKGRIRWQGRDITTLASHRIARLGIAYMPETRGIFPSLSVLENLTLIAGHRPGPFTLERIFEIFPRLKERRSNAGTQISGGEQQLLAIARALLWNPDLLLLDEPTEGLAPIVAAEIQEHLRRLKQEGMTILLVEQNLHFAMDLADEVTVLGRGKVRWQGSSTAFRNEEAVQNRWLGV
ncbi:MAG: ABC transporter ATP-binding protein [Rhodospirillales bacterium]|nr:ABC transporter ATP-binding protein [Rhodospirillales bacterium]